jgi:tellurite resistance protein
MSEKTDNFCNNLGDHLNAIEVRLDRAKASIRSAPDDTREAVEAKKRKIEADFEADKGKVEDAKAKATNWVEGKKAETDSKIEEWKINREIHKLENRADNAEDYAAAAIYIAASAVEEAELSILDAVEARLLSNEVAALG